MEMHRFALDEPAAVTGMTKEERREKAGSLACQRRLRQMAAKREEDAKRKLAKSGIPNGDG